MELFKKKNNEMKIINNKIEIKIKSKIKCEINIYKKTKEGLNK
jgi:hypothetical protein